MRHLILYYSHTGNNYLLADHIRKSLSADLCAITEKKKRTTARVFLDVFLKRNPPIHEIPVRIENYDHLILIAPIWIGHIASPMKTFIIENKSRIGRYSFISLSEGSEDKQQRERVRSELRDLTGNEPDGIFELNLSDLRTQKKKKEKDYKFKRDDLPRFRPQLDQIVHFLRGPLTSGDGFSSLSR